MQPLFYQNSQKIRNQWHLKKTLQANVQLTHQKSSKLPHAKIKKYPLPSKNSNQDLPKINKPNVTKVSELIQNADRYIVQKPTINHNDQPQKRSKSVNISSEILTKTKNSPKDKQMYNYSTNEVQLQQYEHDYLMKERAKKFILKLKKERQKNQGKMLLIKQEQQIRKSERDSIENEMKLKRIEVQRERKRNIAAAKLKQVKFKNQKRSNEKDIIQKLKNSHIELKQPKILNKNYYLAKIKTEESKEKLKNITKRKVSFSGEISINSIPKSKTSQLDISLQNKQRQQSNANRKKQTNNERLIKSQLDKCIYLSIEDERKIDQIKSKLKQLRKMNSNF